MVWRWKSISGWGLGVWGFGDGRDWYSLRRDDERRIFCFLVCFVLRGLEMGRARVQSGVEWYFYVGDWGNLSF